MRELPVSNLKPLDGLPVPMLHKSGTVLLQNGEALSDAVIAALHTGGIDSVFLPDQGQSLEDARRELVYSSEPVNNLEPGGTLARGVYDEDGHLLLEEGTTIPKSFADSLSRRGIDTIYFRKPVEETEPKVGREVRKAVQSALSGVGGVGAPEVVHKVEAITFEEVNPEDLDEETFRRKLDSLEKIEVRPKGEAFGEAVQDRRGSPPVSEEEKRQYSSAIENCLNDLREVFEILERGGRRLEIPGIERVATCCLAGTIENRELLMLCGHLSSDEDYMCHHALAMTIIAVNVGTAMGYDSSQVKSLAYGAMLADVGMLRVPNAIREKTGKLNASEYAEIKRHPAHGLDMLQQIQHIPAEVPYIVYQSHERANGTGYPCGKRDVVVHPFAKIVGMADIYASVCAKRPYREAKTPYEATEQLVLMCGKRMMNADVVRALLSCNSMFPIGSFVELSDGRSARVINANPEDYMRPWIAVIRENGNLLKSTPRVNMMEYEDLKVTQALDISDMGEIGDKMIGF